MKYDFYAFLLSVLLDVCSLRIYNGYICDFKELIWFNQKGNEEIYD